MMKGLYVLILQFNFEGNYDLVKFIKLIGENKMYVTLRVGPFIQAEWNHGYFFLLCLSLSSKILCLHRACMPVADIVLVIFLLNWNPEGFPIG